MRQFMLFLFVSISLLNAITWDEPIKVAESKAYDILEGGVHNSNQYFSVYLEKNILNIG